jgi:hypothetical protein
LFILALYVHFLTILLELDTEVVAADQPFQPFEEPEFLVVVVVFVVVVLVVVVGLGLTIGILKSGCALSINHGILLAFSSERLMKISCPS